MLPRALCHRSQPQKAKLSTMWESRSRGQACDGAAPLPPPLHGARWWAGSLRVANVPCTGLNLGLPRIPPPSLGSISTWSLHEEGRRPSVLIVPRLTSPFKALRAALAEAALSVTWEVPAAVLSPSNKPPPHLLPRPTCGSAAVWGTPVHPQNVSRWHREPHPKARPLCPAGAVPGSMLGLHSLGWCEWGCPAESHVLGAKH